MKDVHAANACLQGLVFYAKDIRQPGGSADEESYGADRTTPGLTPIARGSMGRWMSMSASSCMTNSTPCGTMPDRTQ
eukprot:CAMPEP_0174740032 /NCGR_PEP_ID=MMETSP1094-20130205/72607_1 /TAXON_ID=156173 /ORGANISM="Chrysochromulina brevifilum, Strain UTEX LB 985" /LENGTH=76 /DNA_ID=CAMNT_0015943667 /DNA_START=51 /DNA_END=282 /DNA_ORIENTATION=+